MTPQYKFIWDLQQMQDFALRLQNFVKKLASCGCICLKCSSHFKKRFNCYLQSICHKKLSHKNRTSAQKNH